MAKRAAQKLAEQIDKVASQAGADMIPAPPPKKEEEVIPDIREVIADKADRLKVLRLTTALVEFKAAEKAAKKGAKPLITSIKTVLGKWMVGKCMVDDITLNYYNSPRSSINREKLSAALLAYGVAPQDVASVILASTDTKDSYTLRVTPAGESDDEE